ncbi:MAG: hypothetical protein H7070_14155 [Saprospiraceae bacterium]|nr:hypothetical protein [Pyrinomonadaceae bacterium]
MIYRLKRTLIQALLLALFCGYFLASPGSAQRRDFMTDEEIELIRDSQDIDARMDVITRMIDRRFGVLGIDAGGWKQGQKTSGEWGEPPKGSRLELLSDIKKLLLKAIDDIDNLASHPDSAPIREKGDKEAKKDPQRFSVAVRKLGQAAGRYLPVFRAQLDNSNDDLEKGLLLDSIDYSNQIIEAVGKLTPEVKKK